MDSKKIEPLMTPQDVADVLGWHVQSVYRAASDGRLQKVKIGRSLRFRSEDVQAFIDASDEARGAA